jgi:hypothetical protein
MEHNTQHTTHNKMDHCRPPVQLLVALNLQGNFRHAHNSLCMDNYGSVDGTMRQVRSEVLSVPLFWALILHPSKNGERDDALAFGGCYFTN